MGIKDIFNTFSRRNEEKVNKEKININEQVRNRVYLLLMNLGQGKSHRVFETYSFYFDQTEFFLEIHNLIAMNLGKITLTDKQNYIDEVDDLLEFLPNCEGKVFLDFIEYCFKTKEFRKVPQKIKEEFIEDINSIFDVENTGFMLTKYREYYKDVYREDGTLKWSALDSITYPRIVKKEDEFIHKSSVEPALNLLINNDKFKNANNEFIEGLVHYKNKRYKECISSCCSALESVMKIICSINKWGYNKNSTGLPLIKNIIDKSDSPNWYESIIQPTLSIRNKLGPHGKGEEDIIVKKSQAQLQINLVASQIIFLIEEYM